LATQLVATPPASAAAMVLGFGEQAPAPGVTGGSGTHIEQKRTYVLQQHSTSKIHYVEPRLLPMRPNPWLNFAHGSEVLKKGAAGNGGIVGSKEQCRASPARFHRHIPYRGGAQIGP